MKTKYGNSRINNEGYYVITSAKEGNRDKLLHRLIARDYFGDWIDDPDDFFEIHHIDGDKTNNCVLNLEPIPHDEHIRLHRTGKKHSEESKINMSKAKNTSGYYRVYKNKDKSCKQGFIWHYLYYENRKRKVIASTDIKALEAKVKAKGLKWLKYNKED